MMSKKELNRIGRSERAQTLPGTSRPLANRRNAVLDVDT